MSEQFSLSISSCFAEAASFSTEKRLVLRSKAPFHWAKRQILVPDLGGAGQRESLLSPNAQYDGNRAASICDYKPEDLSLTSPTPIKLQLNHQIGKPIKQQVSAAVTDIAQIH